MSTCPTVETCNGKVIGRVIEKPCGSQKDVYNFQGIPFAKPPVGDLRFSAPQPCDNWDGVYEATSTKPFPQQDPEFSEKMDDIIVMPKSKYSDEVKTFHEDCLYLNVYTSNPSKTANLPVMVWIYGGGFQMGGPGYYDGSGLASLQDVVVVCLSYRVGVLGYISFGPDSECPGNNGMLDQVRGLEWVRDNIQGFGGNPNNVTIFGESAGGMSVGLHVLSPMSKGLFHKAISHSGTANIKTLDMVPPAAVRKHFLSKLEINDEDPNTALEKLKTHSFDEMVPIMQEMLKSMMFFGPTVDGKFLPENPREMIAKKQWNDCIYMIGMNNTEGAGLLTMEQPVGFKDGITKSACKEYVKGMMMLEIDPKKTDKAADLILEEYGKGLDNEDKYRWSRIAGNILGDTWFCYPGVEMAQAYSEAGNPTYMYYMTHTFPMFHYKEYYGSNEKVKKADFCEADHADDLILTFAAPLVEDLSSGVKFNETDKALTHCWLDFLGNFARNGNPNKEGNTCIEWPQFEWEKKSYLNLRYPLETGEQFYQQRREFWNGVIKSL